MDCLIFKYTEIVHTPVCRVMIHGNKKKGYGASGIHDLTPSDDVLNLFLQKKKKMFQNFAAIIHISTITILYYILF